MSAQDDSTFNVATEKLPEVANNWMPTGSIRPLVLDNPGEVWLHFHGESKGLRTDWASPYSFFDFYVEKGRQFKEAWIKNKLGIKKLSPVCEKAYHVRYAAKVRQTLDLMAGQEPVIVEPALWWAREKIYGVPDLLVHTAWLKDRFPSAWQELQNGAASPPQGYVIFEIRFMGATNEKLIGVAETQIRLNSYILGHLQGWMPARGFLVTRNAIDSPRSVPIGSTLGQPLDKDLADIRDRFLDIKINGANWLPWQDDQVKLDRGDPDEPWKTAARQIAWEKTPGGDPAAVYQISASQKKELAAMGLKSIDALLQAKPADLPLEQVEGLKTEAKRVRAILQANRTGRPVLPDKQSIPPAIKFELFVDFEFFNNQNVDFKNKKDWPQLAGREMLFMIGAGWEEGGKWQFQAFTAETETPGGEKKMIEDFIRFLDTKTGGAFTDAGQTALYHWWNAEQRQSRAAADRLGFPADHPFRKLPWVDLHKSFLQTPCAIPGAWSYGLKAVAKALGKLDAGYDPQWVGELDDGQGAMVMGWRAYESDQPLKSVEIKIVEQYLQSDCKAVWCVLRWMRAGAPGLAFDAPDQSYVGWEEVKKGFSRPPDDLQFAGKGEDKKDGLFKGVFVYLQPVLGKRTGIKKVEHLIWGDEVSVLEKQGDWRRVYSRGALGWMHEQDLQSNRLLEVNFIDVGQGDGCFIVTPDNDLILIDAGKEDHIYRFLHWRFRHFQPPIAFKAAVITHPDTDHYYGFNEFFNQDDPPAQNVHFACIYHNGIIERSGDLDTWTKEVIADRPALEKILGAEKKGKEFLGLLRKARDSGRVDDICMLAAAKNKSVEVYMPGYGKGQHSVSIRVLAPVPEGPGQALRLRKFGDKGPTKNGNSIVLRLEYGKVRLLLGGDLNIPAEQYLLGHYGDAGKPFKELTEEEKTKVIEKAHEFLGADVAKSCHHGSADLSVEFLRAIDAVATVVSSGDKEPYCHPRPETLGVLGKYGRGDWPLIFSTELARSAEEKVKHPYFLRQRLAQAVKDNREIEFRDELIEEFGRSVSVYGMIALRTDGTDVLFAQKLEEPGPDVLKWDLHRLSPDKDGKLQYKPKKEK